MKKVLIILAIIVTLPTHADEFAEGVKFALKALQKTQQATDVSAADLEERARVCRDMETVRTDKREAEMAILRIEMETKIAEAEQKVEAAKHVAGLKIRIEELESLIPHLVQKIEALEAQVKKTPKRP